VLFALFVEIVVASMEGINLDHKGGFAGIVNPLLHRK
jgi:hypothetical protein